jgi:protein SCO1/2
VYLPAVLAALEADVDRAQLAAADAPSLASCASCAVPERGGSVRSPAPQGLPVPDDGTGLPSFGALPDFALTADDGRPFTRADLLGGLWLVDFVYTRCSGLCVDLTKSFAALAAEDLPVRLLSITVDPAHDDVAALTAWRARSGGSLARDARWRLLTGEAAEILSLAEQGFRLPVSSDVVLVEGLPQLFHSGRFALVDRQGRVRGTYEPSDALQLAALRADVRALAAARAEDPIPVEDGR